MKYKLLIVTVHTADYQGGAACHSIVEGFDDPAAADMAFEKIQGASTTLPFTQVVKLYPEYQQGW